MKTILLIGAGGGMGSACARLFSANGDRVIGIDRPGSALPDCCIPLYADVTDAKQIEATLAAAGSLTDAIDAIVYAAGIYQADSLVEIDEANLKRIFEVNVFGAYRTVKAFLPLMSKNARVVFVTSELADLDPLPFTGLYGITKGTLDRYAFSLAMELQLIGIHVSVIRPGAVETPLLGGSVKSIEAFTERTTHYPQVAAKFLKVTNAVEAKAVPPERVARKLQKVLSQKHPRFAYSLNRNPLLRLYGILPKSWKLFFIRVFLKSE